MAPSKERLPQAPKIPAVSNLSQARGQPAHSTRRLPQRRGEPPLAVGGTPFARIGRQLVPELAGDRLMLLVEPFAIVGVLAHPHFGAVTQQDLAEPIRVGERLTCRADDVAEAARQIVFRDL